MKLWELQPNAQLKLEVIIQDQNYEFETSVTDIKGNFILVAPVRSKGNIVSFASDSVTKNLIFPRQDKAPIIWKRVAVTTVKIKEEFFYKVVQAGDGFEVNRRSSFRVYIGQPGVTQINFNKRAMDVMVKDVSDNGFSFVAGQDVEDFMGATVHLVFSDGENHFSLFGKIVRKVKISEDKILFGCVLHSSDAKLNKYINEKQREMLIKQREKMNSVRELKNQKNTKRK